MDLIHTKLNLAESMIFVILQVSKRDLENPALQRVVCIFETTGPVNKGLSNASFQLAANREILVGFEERTLESGKLRAPCAGQYSAFKSATASLP